MNSRVKDLSAEAVFLHDKTIACGTIVWGAGIKASAAAQWLGLSGDRIGRLMVEPTLAVKGYDNLYALGDTALFLDKDGLALPALAQVAKQQGEHLGRGLRDLIEKGEHLKEFSFRNRGNTAVVGRHSAVFDFGYWTLKGRMAWLLWAMVHVYLLINFEKRLLVSIQWVTRYLTRQRGARLIDEEDIRPEKTS
ncbi:NAD(P)/FAD-dependent oxidoreductase [Agrobacterium rosae]